MTRGAIYSAILHLSVFLLALFGLPSLLRDESLEVRAITVDVVTIDEETAAPKIDPEPAPAEPEPEPEPKQEAALPPPEPPQIEPPPAPEPPRVETPPPPPPEPLKQPEPTPEPELKPEPPPKPKKAEETPPEVTKPPQTTPILKPKLSVKEKKEEKKKVDFESVLRSVAETEQQRPTKKTGPEPEVQRPPPQTATAFSNKLTVSELDAIRHQIEQCWNVPVGARDVENLIVELSVDMNPDATVRQVRLIDNAGQYQSNAFFRAAADSAIRAMLNPRCSPLQLPLDKYDTWRTFTLNFNPKDMF
jgi:hypothetical protein